jgi:hypothetical protein
MSAVKLGSPSPKVPTLSRPSQSATAAPTTQTPTQPKAPAFSKDIFAPSPPGSGKVTRPSGPINPNGPINTRPGSIDPAAREAIINRVATQYANRPDLDERALRREVTLALRQEGLRGAILRSTRDEVMVRLASGSGDRWMNAGSPPPRTYEF